MGHGNRSHYVGTRNKIKTQNCTLINFEVLFCVFQCSRNNKRNAYFSIPFISSIYLSQKLKLLLVLLHSGKALRAVYRSVVAGLERNFCFLTAVSANSCEHFLGFTACILSLVTACLASLGLILETLFCIEFLLTCCEYEFLAAFLAY